MEAIGNLLPHMDGSSLFGRAAPHSPGEVATVGAGVPRNSTRLENYKCVLFDKDGKQHVHSKGCKGRTQRKCLGSREARVLTQSAMTPKVPAYTDKGQVSEITPHLQVLENQQVSPHLQSLHNQQVSEAIYHRLF